MGVCELCDGINYALKYTIISPFIMELDLCKTWMLLGYWLLLVNLCPSFHNRHVLLF